jgi:hypothetical protein
MDHQLTIQLAELSRMLMQAADDLERLDEQAVRARQVFEVAFARAFLTSDGAMDARKQQAVLATAAEKLDAEIASQQLRACQERLRVIRTRIDVGRSLGAAQRAEFTAGIGT